MKDKKNKVLEGVAKLALNMGKDSVGKCCIWYHQPKMPDKLKEMAKK